MVQDVFLAALHGLATFEGQSALRTWLLGIARHKIEDVYRQRLRASPALDDLHAGEDDPPAEPSLSRHRGRDLSALSHFELAANIAIGRDAAGVHYRSHGIEGLRPGEAVCLSIPFGERACFNEPRGGLSVTTFDGVTTLT